MRHNRFLLIACAVALSGTAVSAQITLINDASGGSRYATTTGNAHSIDTTNFMLGTGSVVRGSALANASYLSTGIVLDPASNGGSCSTADKGYTIQFWYRPAASGTFQYLFGDANWTGASGAFRCFQNGAAGAGNLYMRGPLGQLATTGSPLTGSLNSKGWVHFAVVQNNTKSTITWYVNGAQNRQGASTGSGTGTNFTCMGYDGSSSAGATGNFDGFRVYDWARDPKDIAADYTLEAKGNGQSGCSNVPDVGYYKCDAAVNPHIATVNPKGEPPATFTRLFTTGNNLEWSVSSPATGPFVAIGLINVFVGGPGNPRKDAYLLPPPLPGGPYTSFLPGLKLGSFFSTPVYPAFAFSPGVAYGGPTVGKIALSVPNLGLVNGDRIDFQFIVFDSTYKPLGIGTSNNLTYEFVQPKGPWNCHVEARGLSALQDTGFFEVHNTGILKIKKVCIDLSTAGAHVFAPTGALNSGGTLAAGTSFRYLTDQVCDLTPATNPRYTISNGNATLCFDFDCSTSAPAGGFEGPTNHFIFDCATTPFVAGNNYIGATVTVTFCDNKVLSGKMIADPSDPRAAQVDL